MHKEPLENKNHQNKQDPITSSFPFIACSPILQTQFFWDGELITSTTSERIIIMLGASLLTSM
jgi:hypothetical protein